MRLRAAIVRRPPNEAAPKHFTMELCEWASSRMRRAGDATVPGLHTRETLDALYARTGVRPSRNHGYDDVYVANMCLADFWGSSIQDEVHLARYVKDVIDDPDAAEGQVMARFMADCRNAGVVIPATAI